MSKPKVPSVVDYLPVVFSKPFGMLGARLIRAGVLALLALLRTFWTTFLQNLQRI